MRCAMPGSTNKLSMPNFSSAGLLSAVSYLRCAVRCAMPGSTNKLCTPEECMERIADCINRAHAETRGVTVVLENVAGMVGACPAMR